MGWSGLDPELLPVAPVPAQAGVLLDVPSGQRHRDPNDLSAPVVPTPSLRLCELGVVWQGETACRLAILGHLAELRVQKRSWPARLPNHLLVPRADDTLSLAPHCLCRLSFETT